MPGWNLFFETGRAPGGATAFAVLSLTLWLCGQAPGQEAADRADVQVLSSEQQREFDHLLADIKDARHEPAHRRRAAAILLDRHWTLANDELRRLLQHSADAGTRRAIAQGVAAAENPDAQLIAPLMGMLGLEDAALRTDAAAALGRFSHSPVVDQLAELCLDRHAPAARRLGATSALSHHRTRLAAGTLMEAAGRDDDDPAVRKAALESLAHLTGIREHGSDLQTWRRWWRRARSLDEQAWTAELMRHISRRSADLEKQLTSLSTRLSDTYTQLHDAASDEGRAAIVQRMLADELVEVRLKALWLVEQRVLNAQSQKITDATRAAMRDRLNDPAPAVRVRAAVVLEGLADERAAELVADLLLAERDASVQAAYLKLLTRLPQTAAVTQALQLMDIREVRTACAGFLAAAFDKGLLTGEQRDTALHATRQYLADGQAADSTLLQLLGRVGREEDQVLVLPYLRSSDTALRVAAVDAFGNESWPVAPLLDYLDDPSLRAAVWKLIGKRGRSANTLLKLLDHEPAEPERRVEWQTVVAAVASRLSIEDLVRVDTSLRDQAARRPAHEAVLLAAAGVGLDGAPLSPATNGATPNGASEVKTEAELLLGEFYLRQRESSKANSVYGRLAGRTSLTIDQRRRVDLGVLRRMLQQEALEEASSHTLAMFGSIQSPPIARMSEAWLDAAETSLAANDPEHAATLAARLEELFKDRLDAPAQSRLAQLKRKLPVAGAAAPLPR